MCPRMQTLRIGGLGAPVLMLDETWGAKPSFILTSYVLCQDGNGFLDGSDVFNELDSALVVNEGK
jgi:hypothetical protein